ncbi:MAG: O-antigen ligase family protein [Methylocystis sp.]
MAASISRDMTTIGVTVSSPIYAINSRGALFLAILAITWMTLTPFQDLGAHETMELSEGNDAWNYALYAVFAIAAGTLVWRTDLLALKSLVTPPYLVLAGWIALCCVTSQDPVTSIKRAGMLCFVLVCGASLFLLPRGRGELLYLLSLIALLIIGLSYFGIVFMPQYSIHQATDLGEPELAGLWRGVLGHKNMASAIFSILAFIGLLVRSERPIEGWSIFILSIVFVLNSGGKSSTTILLLTISTAYVALYIRNATLWSSLLLAPLLLLNLLGVGSVLWPGMASVTAALPLDTSFTGRTDIWSFAIPQAGQALILGHGFLSFWNTEALRYGMEQSTMWVGNAAHAHNGYLDTVLSMGLPGLALTVAALVVKPMRDIRRALTLGEEPALAAFFMQIWMFCLYFSSFESFFFDRAQPMWLALLFAIFGAHYISRFKVAR